MTSAAYATAAVEGADLGFALLREEGEDEAAGGAGPRSGQRTWSRVRMLAWRTLAKVSGLPETRASPTLPVHTADGSQPRATITARAVSAMAAEPVSKSTSQSLHREPVAMRSGAPGVGSGGAGSLAGGDLGLRVGHGRAAEGEGADGENDQGE